MILIEILYNIYFLGAIYTLDLTATFALPRFDEIKPTRFPIGRFVEEMKGVESVVKRV
jgi:hypothetical protein